MNAQWIGGPEDGAYTAVSEKARFVVYETVPGPDGTKRRYTIPVEGGQIIWGKRVEHDANA